MEGIVQLHLLWPVIAAKSALAFSSIQIYLGYKTEEESRLALNSLPYVSGFRVGERCIYWVLPVDIQRAKVGSPVIIIATGGSHQHISLHALGLPAAKTMPCMAP